MSRRISNRIKQLERKSGVGSGFKKYLDAIMDTTRGLTSNMPPISPEKQAEIKIAFAQLSNEEFNILSKYYEDREYGKLQRGRN